MIKRIVLTIIFIVFGSTGCSTTKVWTSIPQIRAIENPYYKVRFEPLRKTDAFFVAFRLEVDNQTDTDLKIDWNKTQYLLNGRAHGGFVFKGIDREKIRKLAIPDDVVYSGQTFSKEISPYTKLARAPIRTKGRSEGEAAIQSGILPEGENGIVLVIRKNGDEIRERISVDIEVEQECKWF